MGYRDQNIQVRHFQILIQIFQGSVQQLWVVLNITIDRYFTIHSRKGLRKMKGGIGLTSKSIRWWSLLILLLSVASISRKFRKLYYSTYFDYRFFFDVFVYSWYFIIFFICLMHFKLRLVRHQVSLLSMFLWFHMGETPSWHKIVD